MIYFLSSLGIINEENIASVINDSNFSAQTLDEYTEMVWMEEWTERSLRADDAKRLLQGKHFSPFCMDIFLG